ncbi:MAG: S41 family peptidase [Phycisphaerae bacterium]|jgi:carboxyl-terminal processing protease|nr:S41 family peptidase [Phycisphaerae bacterium]MCZ2400679.1 S41 family peptidase [Phycisphaerae bacterium]NUQ49741.1 S41 family peptidase [Phycisphaerae bacterium]
MSSYCRPTRYVAAWLLLGVLGADLRAQETLDNVYAAILRGDYQGGREKLAGLLGPEAASAEAQRVDTWLKQFGETVKTRSELRSSALAWNVDQAHKADDGGRVYLALSFASQALAYAEDKAALRGEAWLGRLRSKGLALAAECEQRGKWTNAWAYYSRLSRIWPDDQQLTKMLKRAARHWRLELVYKDKHAVDERMKGVSPYILDRVIRAVDDNYYEKPDFVRMGDGALDQLGALCNTTKLQTVFDGVANPDLREHFLAGLERLRQKMHGDRAFGARGLMALFGDLRELNKSSVSLPQALLVVEFLEGALGELDDFTSVVWPADAADFDKRMIGNFCGVGIQLGIDESTSRLKVVTPLEDSPALEAGIRPNDLIFAVNGESTKNWTTDDAVDNITGEPGTTVTLTIYRPETKDRFDFPLVRRRIQLTTVRGVSRAEGANAWNFMLDADAGIAYIRLTGFNPDSHRELERALAEASKQGMRGLVLDLRHNPGGLLDVAVNIVGMFLEKGEVVATAGRIERRQHLEVPGNAPYADLPLVVLVNEGSASASEIVAGALQDHNRRAVVLGERTFGKGSVQRVLQVANDARLKLTTALYHLPSGRTPHKAPGAETWGVTPDWTIELTPIEFRKVLERETRAFVIRNDRQTSGVKIEPKEEADDAADGKTGTRSDLALSEQEQGDDLLSEDDITLLQSAPYTAPDADPQLETAVLQLRVKLAANLPWPRQIIAKKDDAAAAPSR